MLFYIFLVFHYKSLSNSLLFRLARKQKSVYTAFCLKRRAVNTLSIASGYVLVLVGNMRISSQITACPLCHCQDQKVKTKNLTQLQIMENKTAPQESTAR